MNSRKRHDTTRCDTDPPAGAPQVNRLSGTGHPGAHYSSTSPQEIDTADRLESWKEIAAFVQRDVRSAMRWEEQGMPVRRLPGGKRGRVYASKGEITRWLQGQPVPESPSESPSVSKRRTIPIVAAAIGALLIAIALVTLNPLYSRSLPSRMQFGESAVEAFSAEGRHLWTYRYSRHLDSSAMGHFGKLEEFVRVGDFRGDGHREVILVAPFRLSINPDGPLEFEVDCLSESGTLLWSYTPRERFRFGDHEIAGHWFLQALIVSNMSRHVIWVAFSDSDWGNSLVESIDALTGHAALRYVNTGTTRSLEELRTPQATYLLAGTFNNEYDGASLAIVDERRPFAASPQTAGTRHQCLNCPAGLPDYYFVFPRSEVNRLRRIYEAPGGSADRRSGAAGCIPL